MMRIRFSLKLALFAFVFLGIVLAIFAKRLDSFRRQEAIAQKLSEKYADDLNFVPSSHWFDMPARFFLDQSRVGHYRSVDLTWDQFEPGEEAECIDLVLKLKNVKEVNFGDNFSIASYDKCHQAGITVEHNGMTDLILKKNFIFKSGSYSPIDLEKSGISILIEADSEQVCGFVSLQVKDGPYVGGFAKNINLESGFVIPLSVGDEMHTSTDNMSFDEIVDSGNLLYDGIHHSTCDFKVRLLSKGTEFWHLDFDFAYPLIESDFLGLANCSRASVNAKLPLRQIAVEFASAEEISIERANSLLGELGFETNQFSTEIDRSDSTKSYRVEYKVK